MCIYIYPHMYTHIQIYSHIFYIHVCYMFVVVQFLEKKKTSKSSFPFRSLDWCKAIRSPHKIIAGHTQLCLSGKLEKIDVDNGSVIDD